MLFVPEMAHMLPVVLIFTCASADGNLAHSYLKENQVFYSKLRTV